MPAADPIFSSHDVARLRAQHPGAFAQLVEQTRRIVLGLGQSTGLHGADLDDATAEAYLAVYRALPNYEGRSAVTTWVYTIAARTLVAWRTKLRRHPTVALPESGSTDATASSPDVLAERAETNERVWAAVAELEPRSAMAVELFYRRGLDIDAVAAVLACPAGTVKTLLYRARQALKLSLREEANHV